MKLAKPMAALAATLLVGTLAACSSDAPEEDPSTSAPVVEESSTPAPTSAAPSPSATEAPAEAPVEAGDMTPAGTELSTSEPLNVSLRSTIYDKDTEEVIYDDVAAVYTFDGIREGSPDDLAGVFGDDDLAKLADYDLVYVDYKVELPGGPLTEPGMGVAEVTDLDVYDTAGTRGSGGFIFFDGGPDVCAYASLTDIAAEGSTTACQIVALTKGETVDFMEFAGSDSGEADNPYADSPIVWKVG